MVTRERSVRHLSDGLYRRYPVFLRDFQKGCPPLHFSEEFRTGSGHPCLRTQRNNLIEQSGTAVGIQMRRDLIQKQDRRRPEICAQSTGIRKDQ